MEDSVFNLLDDIDGRARASTQNYSIDIPSYQYQQNLEASQHHEPRPWPVDDPYQYARTNYNTPEGEIYAAQELPFDAFDQELLRQPYDDRQRQAEEGRARLTLPPNATTPADVDAYRALQPIQNIPGGQTDEYYRQVPLQPLRRDLSRFAYSQASGGQSSSSPRALASSPAFRANQRRNDNRVSQSQIPSRHQRRVLADNEATGQSADFQPSYLPAGTRPINLSHAPQLVQGIELVSTHELPDRFRAIFKFPVFNAVQSKCFQTIYRSNDNFVLSSPTGSGKTAILELAICRIINGYKNGQYKIVYQAPTKSLCSERQRDWQAKFGPLDLQCAELTGDTDQVQLRNVQNASIIITTPEKWDSMTRKWKDHEKLMQMVKLFLIDEVHILKEDRGATLEAVVSRMKSVGSDVRFVALSATVPNSEDIATWLGKNPMNQHIPAPRERFGEEFRPVKLQKHVVGYQSNGNDFAFDKVLNAKLPEVISKHSHRKPIMIFCCTRISAVNTAKALANWWATKGPKDRYWEAPRRPLTVKDGDLQHCVASAVAFHHAGIELEDRHAVENGFLAGAINVICCTSTLAVGVNLPCHFVIIKNTVSYVGNSCKEYSDLEVMQMLGRAGRPQFDSSAIAVIMTRQEKVRHYEKMVSGQEILESCLHLNIIDHLNAEIGLGTITDVHSAKRWLSGTFLYVRLKENPDHYHIDGDTRSRDLDERIEKICRRDIALLQEYNLVSADPKLKSTEFGDAMARYYLKFETMKVFLGLPPKAKSSEILSALAQAAEFHEVRFRSGEKPLYKDLNKSPSIKFPIPVDLALPAHKVSLIIQSVLGGVELPVTEKTSKHRLQYNTDVAIIFQHVHRLIRCVIDCQLYLEDSVASRNALTLARSLGARVWDDSPLQLKQIEGIGIVAVRKFVNAGIKSIEALEGTEPHRIETILSKNAPFGMKLLDRLKGFPKLRVSVHMVGPPVVKSGEGVRINVKAEIGFMNERSPVMYQRKAVYVCLLAETLDGHKIHFCRISGKKLNNGQDVLFSATLTNPNQSISCYVMCDEIAGTSRHAMLVPQIPASAFPPARAQVELARAKHPSTGAEKPGMNTSRRRTASATSAPEAHKEGSEDFGLNDIEDSDLIGVAAGDNLDFRHIDTFGDETTSETRRNTAANTNRKKPVRPAPIQDEGHEEPRRLDNGKWACNHRCKDKTSCKHLCCRDGLDKPPRPVKGKPSGSELSSKQQGLDKSQKKSTVPQKSQTKLKLTTTKQNKPLLSSSPSSIPHLDLSKELSRPDYLVDAPQGYKNLHRLHTSVQRKPAPASVTAASRKKPGYSYAGGTNPGVSFLPDEHAKNSRTSSDFSNSWMEGLPSPTTLTMTGEKVATTMSPPHHAEADEMEMLDAPVYDDDDSMLDAAMVGLADSQNIQATQGRSDPSSGGGDWNDGIGQEEGPVLSWPETRSNDQHVSTEQTLSSGGVIQPAREMGESLFLNDTSSPRSVSNRKGIPSNVPLKRSVDEMKFQEPMEVVPIQKKPKTSDAEAEYDSRSEDDIRIIEGVGPDTEPDAKSAELPSGLEGVDPWLIEEYGDYVEFT